MKKLFLVLCAVIVTVTSQDESSRAGCIGDAFSLAAGEHCSLNCMVRDTSRYLCFICNQTCNATLRDGDCNFRGIRQRCSLSCTLSQDDNGCPECDCEDTDEDETAVGALNPCRVNSTYFASSERCNLRCVSRRYDGCFMCDRACNDTESSSDSGNECGIRRQCSNGSICLLQGLLNQCVRMPRMGQECDIHARDTLIATSEEENDEEDDEDDSYGLFSIIRGALDRQQISRLLVSAGIRLPCLDGSTCSREGQCVQPRGPCTRRRNGTDQCDEDGNFAPLQCRRMNGNSHTCHCVNPWSGRIVIGTMKTGILRRHEVPDCESKVFRSCNYEHEGRNFTVHHRDRFVHRPTCMKCRCHDGNATECRPLAGNGCQYLTPPARPQHCTHGNRTIQHGRKHKVGRCNVCGCNNGRLTCTDIEGCSDGKENKGEKERKCELCQHAPKGLVCGRDGRTYLSRCIAVNCSGLGENDTLDGPCTNQPVCNLYPCQEGFACVPLGGRSCLRKSGCTADERRICVNRTALSCRVSNVDENGFEEDMVCGSDRRTYQSFCHMIQQAPPNTRVGHTGMCHHGECNSGQVCGTDGVTYDSVCHLRAQSANAQVDYRGMCVDGDGTGSLRDVCHAVRETKCEVNNQTCKHRVQTRDGCCPICGGITTLAIDKDALDEYSRATDSDANVDEFMARMTRDDVIPEEVRRRCVVEATHVRNSTETNIEVKILAKHNGNDSHFCHNYSKTFADTINNATNTTITSSSDVTSVTTLPVEVSFASAAAAAPLIVDQSDEGSNNNNGAPSLQVFGFFTYLALLVAAVANMAAVL